MTTDSAIVNLLWIPKFAIDFLTESEEPKSKKYVLTYLIITGYGVLISDRADEN